MRKLILAAALATSTAMVAATPAPANAQTTTFSASRIIKGFDIATLRAVVTELGGTVEPKDDGNGYRIKFDNGTVTSAYFTACNSGVCLGTHLQGSFGKPSDKTISETETIVTDFNKDNRTLKVWNLGEGRSMADHYIIADGGITMENYRRQLSLYSYMLKRYREAIYTDG